MSRNFFKRKVTFAVLVSVATLCVFPIAAGAAKINPNVTTSTLAVYQSQVISVSLSQPIICPTLPSGVDCEVVLPLTISDPNRIQTSETELRWLFNEWAQSRTFVVTYTDDGTFNNGDDIVTISSDAVATAPFYSDASISVAVTAIEANAAPTTTVAPVAEVAATANDSALPDTGSDSETLAYVALAFIVLGVIAMVATRKKSDRSAE